MKLKFLHITKTGGTSIENAAKEQGIFWGRFDKDLKFLGQFFWHCPFQFCKRQNRNKKNKIANDFEFFVVVRNPYDRCVSEYFCRWGGPKDNQNTKEQMNQYIANKMNALIESSDRKLKRYHFMPQYRYVFDGKGKRFVKHIVKFENLKEEFDVLMKTYDIPLVLEKHDNPSVKNLSADDLDEQTKKLIQKVYKRDFIEFSYPL